MDALSSSYLRISVWFVKNEWRNWTDALDSYMNSSTMTWPVLLDHMICTEEGADKSTESKL
jgi:hypothetical protein